MRTIAALIGIATLFPLSLAAGEPKAKQDYAEFSKLVHGMVVKQLPKQFEDNTAWGQMTEIPANLPLMGLRKTVKVGDKLEAPHGPWFRFKGKIEDPDKNLKITIKDFKKIDVKTYRILADVDVTVMCQGEWQQWQKGLLLIGADASADANFTAALVCDIGVSLNIKKFPPELNIEPKVAELGLELVDFKLRGGPVLKGEKGKIIANEFKELLKTLVKASDVTVKDIANKAIVQAIKEGKGTISAGEIMKSLPAPK